MWIFMNDSFVSAVTIRDNPDSLKVRARFRQDLERLFPDKEILESTVTDYPFRCIVSKKEFADLMHDKIMNIDYGNFKDSARSRGRAKVYGEVWYEMLVAQQNSTIKQNG